MIAPIITQIRLETNVNVVLAPALLDKIITKHMQTLNKDNLEFTWLDAFKDLTLLFQDAHSQPHQYYPAWESARNCNKKIWDTLVNECFEKLSREEECPTV